ncbi:MAG: DUF354 domain-containing protein [Gammaproteobacteria bacterium]|nr:DUF354 domain-containing protein [Gammaproteobacteria bacterium]
MKVWIDITNSPHVLFFRQMIRELETDHEIIITCRPLANTIDLLDMEGLDYSVVGKHYGRNKIAKILGFFIRVIQLALVVARHRPDVSISHSSFYSPVVSRLLRVPCIYLNDNEHARGNVVSFLFATRILVPEFLDVRKVVAQRANPAKIRQYPGVKEGVYLWALQHQEAAQGPARQAADTVFVRPEPRTAEYYAGQTEFMDELLLNLQSDVAVQLLPRDNVQREHYQEPAFAQLEVAVKPISLSDIINRCILFIGAGGTMTREAAVLGIPTISIYQEALLDVDRYLVSTGLMAHNSSPTAQYVRDFLAAAEGRPPNKELLEKGRQAHQLILAELVNLGDPDRSPKKPLKARSNA